jgi:hypothetical protein
MLKNSPRMPQTEWVAALHRGDGCADNRGDNAADGDENAFDAAQKNRAASGWLYAASIHW